MVTLQWCQYIFRYADVAGLTLSQYNSAHWPRYRRPVHWNVVQQCDNRHVGRDTHECSCAARRQECDRC